MTMEQLNYFIAIVEHNTFLEAAESVNLSQSALSKQIMRLEKELDLKLFDRSRRSAELTEAGSIFCQDARAMLRLSSNMKEHLKPFTNGRQDTIRLGTLPFLTQYNLTPLLKQFTQENPDIRLLIEEVEDEQLMRGLDDGTYDLAITRDLLLTKGIYRHIPLAEDELEVMLPFGHPLSNQPQIALTELALEDYILMPPHVSIHSLCLQACLRSGFTPHILRTARLESIISAVASGEGISLVCRQSLQAFRHSDVICRPLTEQVRTFVVLARRSKSRLSAASALLFRYLSGISES